jgi:hypothetical protein
MGIVQNHLGRSIISKSVSDVIRRITSENEYFDVLKDSWLYGEVSMLLNLISSSPIPIETSK